MMNIDQHIEKQLERSKSALMDKIETVRAHGIAYAAVVSDMKRPGSRWVRVSSMEQLEPGRIYATRRHSRPDDVFIARWSPPGSFGWVSVAGFQFCDIQPARGSFDFLEIWTEASLLEETDTYEDH